MTKRWSRFDRQDRLLRRCRILTNVLLARYYATFADNAVIKNSGLVDIDPFHERLKRLRDDIKKELARG